MESMIQMMGLFWIAVHLLFSIMVIGVFVWLFFEFAEILLKLIGYGLLGLLFFVGITIAITSIVLL